ncbi:hypothetical protein [Streptomyces sp. NPDC020983]|uniref:hypothetical protein n=1 Tax=Streptomyces sp. NPDC020983 TaxID=3365106 RepID=UPI0037AA46B7
MTDPRTTAAALAALLALAALVLRRVRRARRRTPAAVIVAALGALLCTAYSGDTSWNFARDHLAMHGVAERAVMFAAAELALFAVALMARQNLGTTGAPGTPGTLVWLITGVQVIPAYSESGIVAGTVRAFVGPGLAALLWHLAMGIELRHHKPGEESRSLPAVLVREARERLLSYLGLSRRGRDAAQITRDRWTRTATRRAARLADLIAAGAGPRRVARARRRLATAVDRTDAGVLPEQRAVLLDRLAAYRGAADLASMSLPAPWAVTPGTVERDAVTATVPPAHAAGPGADTERPDEGETSTPMPGAVTQASEPEPPAADLAELAVVAGVPTPAPGDQLAAEQLVVVLRWLRYQEDPPRSYRAAVTAFRDAGYVGSEERVRRAWGDLMSREEDGTAAR